MKKLLLLSLLTLLSCTKPKECYICETMAGDVITSTIDYCDINADEILLIEKNGTYIKESKEVVSHQKSIINNVCYYIPIYQLTVIEIKTKCTLK